MKPPQESATPKERATQRQRETMLARHGDSPRAPDRPEPGCFLFRIAKGQPHLPTRILYGPPKDPVTGETLDRSWRWQVAVAGLPWRDPNVCPDQAGAIRVWTYGKRISRAEHDRRLAAYREQLNIPGTGIGDRSRPIDLDAEPPPF